MELARTEANRWLVGRLIRRAPGGTEGEILSYSWGMGFEYGFAEGAAWAIEQGPTDEEVEAADKAFHEVIMSGEWVTQEQAIRASLLAAQKVRAGQ